MKKKGHESMAFEFFELWNTIHPLFPKKVKPLCLAKYIFLSLFLLSLTFPRYAKKDLNSE